MRLKQTLKKIKNFIVPEKVTYVNVQTTTDSSRLKDQVILVTGGGSGIGKAVATLSVSGGGQCIILGRRKHNLDAVCRELGEEQCQSIEFDVTRYSDYEMLFDRAEKIFGKSVTCFVSNAGVYIDKEPLEVTEEDFDKTIAVNLKASVLLI